MEIRSILTSSRTHSSLAAASKKKAIEEASRQIALDCEDLEAQEIYERLISREKIGTTAIGHGIAIPHCRVDDCEQIVGSLFRLDEPVDFESFDDEPVRILFVLLVPKNEVEDHLETLALLATRFENTSYRQRLFEARDDEELFNEAVADLEDAKPA
ncbi:MAG: PTS sugar transporter subunit IIA [Gammaproteobacteria bacterium]|nr:PTS sugar transporter subunit IIA [Gammaproteobacteria bacterium]